MSTGSKKKRRIDRVASVELPPGVFGNMLSHLRRGHVLVRLAMCAVTAVLLWTITHGWTTPMPYHLGDVPQRDIVARTEFAREDQGSTGLEKGIAVPHAKTDAVKSITVAIGVSPEGVDFEAMDGKLSHLFFLMLAPSDQASQHVETLSEIARLTRSPMVLKMLIAASSPEEVMELFTDE